jgi:ATP-dependent RNA helicase SUPV3L1/SUV3
VLERQKVAEDVKGLDQPQRASLRKYGVRFGAYHLYIPALLKPAPRTLATLLYALKHDSDEMRGLDEVQQLASSGRTSIAANKDFAKNLYRVAGYRVAGERAVRVDILERLADLIRPALAWRDNAPGIKPQGALDGTGFTTTVGMTSLVGSSGEDFASILRSLGYRMERRPKPPEPVVTPSVEAAAEPSEVATPPAENEQEQPAGEAAAESVDAAPVETPPLAESEPAEREAVIEAAAVAEAAPVVEAPLADATGPQSSEANESVAESATEAATPAEPELIEVWRPGRIEHRERRPHGRHRRDKNRDQTQGDRTQGDQPAAASPPTGDAAPTDVAATADSATEGAPQSSQPDQRQRGPRPPRHDRQGDRQGERHGERHGERQGGRPPRHERPRHGKPQGGAPRHEPRADARPRPERREKQPDPNSPFAKLAALKAQLEADSKERR